MYCKKCGTEIKSENKFCPKCGAVLDKKKTIKKLNTYDKKGRKKWIVFLILFILLLIVGGFLKLFVFTPSEGVKKHVFSGKEQNAISRVVVEYTLQGIGGKVHVDELNEQTEWMTETVGMKGTPIDISVQHQKVKNANIEFTYDDSLIKEADAEKLVIAYYNEELGRMELLDDSVVDKKNHTVSVRTTHFSRYAVVDSEEWYKAWAQSQLVIRDESLANNYFDIVFTLDCSGSMDGTDKNGLSKECTYNFIRGLYDGDYFTLLKFNDDAETVLPKQRVEDVVSWELVQSTIQGVTADGGTNIEAAIQASNENSERVQDDVVSFIVLLSDGQSVVSDEVLRSAADKGVRIITIGFGTDADEETLKRIADETNGQYYKAGEDDIDLIFENIREEYVGVGLKADRDNDGIPDKVEKIGMRNQYGKVIRTDPDNPDTDKDGIGDGMEMGEVVTDEKVSEKETASGIRKHVYFSMSTDPTIYNENTTYNPKAILSLKSDISEDKTKVTIGLDCSNGAGIDSTDKGAKNVINDIKNAKIKITAPECLTIDNMEKSIGNIKSSEPKRIEKTLQHDSTKCSGEKHVIIVEFSGKNIEAIKKEIRLKGLYWHENLSDDERDTMPGLSLVQKVYGYSSTFEPDEIEDVISNSNMSQEEIHKYWEKQKKDSLLRNRLKYLCNNDIYVAHHFQLYMENQNIIEKGVIDTSKLVFNDGVINTVLNHPEQDRYKQMLVNYINDTMEERQKNNQVEMLMEVYDGVISSYSSLASDLNKQQAILQQECKTAVSTINSNLEYLKGSDKTPDGMAERVKTIVAQEDILKKNNINVNVMEHIETDALTDLENETNRLNKISKAASTGALIVQITADGIDMFQNISEISAIAQTYKEYGQLLTLIEEKTTYPELAAAAKELGEELNDKYKLYANESWDFMMNTGINTLSTLSGASLADFCGVASNIVGTVGITTVVTKFVLNETLGIDDLLENSVYVVGASEISDILSDKMQKCRSEFLKSYSDSYEKAYESALDFRYFYIELQQMRLYGEEQYLKVKGIDGAWDIFGNAIKEWNKYEDAYGICNDTIQNVEDMTF